MCSEIYLGVRLLPGDLFVRGQVVFNVRNIS
jgi:hypothetical protein